MSRSETKIPSPARSHNVPCSPLQRKLRRTRSVCSNTSNASVRLTDVISDSFRLSPLPKRHSVLNDDTNIEVSNRVGWWNRLRNNSEDVTTIMNEQDINNITAKDVAEEMDADILSQEKENFTLDLPESSDNESIRSIVMPAHKLFTHKDNKPQKKFQNLEKKNDTSANLKKSYFAENKEIDIRPKKLFNQVQKPKTKPVFNEEFLTTSLNKTITKSAPNMKRQVQNLFGHRPDIRQKNIYADCIATDSDDEIPELQTKLFGFQKRTTPKRRTSQISEMRSSTLNATDLEMDSWKHLPSSTIIDADPDEVEAITPLRKTRMSQLSKTTEINTPLNQHNRSNNFELVSDKSNSIICNGDKVLNSSKEPDQNRSYNKSTNSNSMQNNKSSTQKSLEELTSANVMQNISVDKTLVHENEEQKSKQMFGINSKQMQNISLDKILIPENVNHETEKMVEINFSLQMLNISVNKTLIQENVNKETEETVNTNSKQIQNIILDKTLIQENVIQETQEMVEINFTLQMQNISVDKTLTKESANQQTETMVDVNSKEMQNISIYKTLIQENINKVTRDMIDINSKQNEKESDQEKNKTSEENQVIEIVAQSNDRESEGAERKLQKENQINQEQIDSFEGNEILENKKNISNNQSENESNREPEVIAKEGAILDCKEELESHVDEYSEQEEDMMECDHDKENSSTDQEYENIDSDEPSPNVSNDDSGSQSIHSELEEKSPEAVLHDTNNRDESFTVPARNSSVVKSKTLLNQLNIRSIIESVRYSDGSANSSTEGSGWDSHRTLRKTFGRDFSVKKSLRTLVLEKSVKRQTNGVLANKSKRQTAVKDMSRNFGRQCESNSPEVSQFDSYEHPEPLEVDETLEESSQENKALKQIQLKDFLQRTKQKHADEQRQVEEEVQSTLKTIAGKPYNPFKMPELPKAIRRVTKNTMKRSSKPKPKRTELVTEDMLPPEFLKDIKYKPPKRFQGAKAPWITKRLYKYLEQKLEPKYDYKARVRAERLVQTLYRFAKDVRRSNSAPQEAIDALKLEMARLNIVNTHYDFYNFFHEFMPREVRIRVNPDIMNKITLPKNVFGVMIQQEQV